MKTMKIREMLELASDSEKMPGINDALSFQVIRTRQKYDRKRPVPLAEEDLAQVAGGVDLSPADGCGNRCVSCGSYRVVNTDSGWRCMECGAIW